MKATRKSRDEAANASATANPQGRAGQRASASAFSCTSAKNDVLTVESLDAALSTLEIGQFRYEASFLDFQSTRSQLTQRIFRSSSRMRCLPKFLSKWSALLGFFSESEANTATPATAADHQYWSSLCKELLEIAQTFKSMGDIRDARAHLGKCIALARRYGHANQGQEPTVAAGSSEIIVEKAKQALVKCIRFQESLANCQLLLLRSKSPPQVLGDLVRETDVLSSQAPFSVEIVRIKTDLLWQTHQYAAIVNCLSTRSSLGEMDAHLTFTLARALENLGLHQQSLNAIAKWQVNEDSAPEHRLLTTSSEDCVAAIHSHKQRLSALLECKSTAEQLQRDEKYQEAARCYSECVALLGSDCNSSFKASLLFHRANTTLLMAASTTATTTNEVARHLSSAISDLTLSLKLKPSNPLANLRLDTALLQLETEKLKSRVK